MFALRVSRKNLLVFLADLNCVLLLIGFPLYTLIVDGIAETRESNFRSIVFRALHLALALLVIFLSKDKKNFNSSALLLWCFFLTFCRIVYDGYLRADSALMPTSVTNTLLLQAVGMAFIPVTAVAFSFNKINLERVQKLCFGGLLIMMLVFQYHMLSGHAIVNNSGRVNLSVAQSSLTLAKCGGWLAIISLALLINTSNTKEKIFYLFTLFLGLWSSFVAGSRGAVVGTIVALYYLLNLKHDFIKTCVYSLFVILVIFLMRGVIWNFLENVFPVLMARFSLTIEEGDMANRDSIFSYAFNQFLDHPILGDWLLIRDFSDPTNLAHNLILGMASSLGIVGLIMIIAVYVRLFRSIYLIHVYPKYAVYGGLCVCMMVMSISGGSMHQQDYCAVFMLTLLIREKIRSIYSNYHE